jgi:hypothetical protein
VDIEATHLESKIATAFVDRKYPDLLTQRSKTSFADEEDVEVFSGRTWQEIDQNDLNHASYALYHFSDDAFCYFLPGILTASLRSDFKESLVYDVLTSCFSDSIDGFWSSRRDKLSLGELEAISDWFLAFKNSEPQFDVEKINMAIRAIAAWRAKLT